MTGGHEWQGGHTWQGGKYGRGGHVWQGAYMAVGHVWQGVHGRGVCGRGHVSHACPPPPDTTRYGQ